ncbi:MAG: putative oxidoreductase (related to aryl-alcohol dehydrogenase) [Halonotius sp. J07HN6]|nr:MAG: putative oxidoreductase (related to aryl-alcohol dehydrogenase) [Halonotius sp. J07HN6]
MATDSGTWAYRDRFGDRFGRTYFRRFPPGVCSSIGLGTYLGEPTDAVDDDYRASITAALDSGINMIDTAINYRCQRSERVVGDALATSDVDREEVVVATKGGFLPFDGSQPDEPGEYIREQYIDTDIADRDTLVRGSHSIEAGVIDHLLDRSLSNLDLDRIDCYYVHNPETQLLEREPQSVYDSLETTFELLERRRAAGDIGCYGLATWEAFRVPPSAEQHLSLATLLDRAARAADAVGVDDHGLQVIQLPFNIEMADAFTQASQPAPPESDDAGSDSDGSGGDSIDADTDDGRVSALEYAHEVGLHVVTSASIGQAALAESIPPAIAAELAGDTTAQQAINFARSAPGVTTSLVGMSSPDHVDENVAAGTFDPLGASAFDAIFE